MPEETVPSNDPFLVPLGEELIQVRRLRSLYHLLDQVSKGSLFLYRPPAPVLPLLRLLQEKRWGQLLPYEGHGSVPLVSA